MKAPFLYRNVISCSLDTGVQKLITERAVEGWAKLSKEERTRTTARTQNPHRITRKMSLMYHWKMIQWWIWMKWKKCLMVLLLQTFFIWFMWILIGTKVVYPTRLLIRVCNFGAKKCCVDILWSYTYVITSQYSFTILKLRISNTKLNVVEWPMFRKKI